jgi:hypothetical protein
VGQGREGPHTRVPQNEQIRAAVPATRLVDGARSTVVVIWDPEHRAWVLYPDCAPGWGIRIAVEVIAPLVALLGTVPG